MTAEPANPCRIRTHSRQRLRIDRARLTLHDVAVITRGPAESHDLWCDETFLRQVADAINDEPGGVESRQTHFGPEIGVVKLARVDEGIVRADLHFHEPTPDAEYFLRLAGDDSEALGLSIRFDRDLAAEEEFTAAHTDPEAGDFRSPDVTNVENFPHVRLACLHACDIVEEPAANPCGLFSRRDSEPAWDDLFAFVVGATNKPPAGNPFGIDPRRFKEFAVNFLRRHRLTVGPKGTKRDVRTAAAPTDRRAAMLTRLRTVNADLQRRLTARELGARLPVLNPCRICRGRA